MSLRTEAILILRQAREILIERLAERIVESRDAILDDARGELYLGGIDEIYEQLASRLSHVNAMLGHLPAEDATVTVDAHAGPLDERGMAAATVLDTIDFSLSERVDLPALPAPHSAPPHTAQQSAAAPASMRVLSTQMFTGDLDAAGQSLAELFAIEPLHGRRCAEAFAAALAGNPEVMLRAMTLRKQLAAGNHAASLSLLDECFGLRGLEAVLVLQTLLLRLQESRGEDG